MITSRPFTGARVETLMGLPLAIALRVAPSQGRELKLNVEG